MNPTAYLVCGPPSTGLRLTARILVAAGCDGDGRTEQRFDRAGDWEGFRPASDGRRPIVWHRSIPHGRPPTWPRIPALVNQLWYHGYLVHLIVTVRNWYCVAASQAAAHGYHGNLMGGIGRAYQHIFQGIGECNLPWTMAVYESFLLDGLPAVNPFLDGLGLAPLDSQALETLTNENRKYYAH